jgi:hypothetical protein
MPTATMKADQHCGDCGTVTSTRHRKKCGGQQVERMNDGLSGQSQ